jgi:hypothetical protein
MEDKRKLGELGELVVAHLMKAKLSSNPFDSEKDMTDSSDDTIEVKTQNRWTSIDCFTIPLDKQTNFKKCLNVKRLIFVEYDHSDYIHVWECTDRQNYFIKDTKNGKRVCWPISKMKQLHRIKTPPLANKMRELSQASEFVQYKDVQRDIFVV